MLDLFTEGEMIASLNRGGDYMSAEVTVLSALRRGSTGRRVYIWQSFLKGKGFSPGEPDGDFGKRTEEATIEYQRRYGLSDDGVAGQQTFLKAITQGFELIEQPRVNGLGSDFPPLPKFSPLISNKEREKVFGKFMYEPAPTADSSEDIRILGTWQSDNIIKVPVPQIKAVKGSRSREYIWFHKLAATQLQKMWAAWEKAGLLDRVLSYEGSFNARFVRGSKTNLSNHSFGSGFDINYSWNKLGHRPALVGDRGSVRELVPIANDHGFFWGGHYAGRKDGMHFEVAELRK